METLAAIAAPLSIAVALFFLFRASDLSSRGLPAILLACALGLSGAVNLTYRYRFDSLAEVPAELSRNTGLDPSLASDAVVWGILGGWVIALIAGLFALATTAFRLWRDQRNDLALLLLLALVAFLLDLFAFAASFERPVA